MAIDQATLVLVQGLVLIVAGIVYILDTALRRGDGTGRLWSLAFIAGIMTAFSYMVWSVDAGAWWAVAVGNASFVSAIGLMWAGFRKIRNAPARSWVVAIAAGMTAAAVLAPGPAGGSWAGAQVMFACIAAFAALAGAEGLRASTGSTLHARVLGIGFFVVAVYYALRTVVFVLVGPTHPLFTVYFGTVTTSILTIVFLVIAVVSMSTLRLESAGPRLALSLRGAPHGGRLFLDEETFAGLAADILEGADFQQTGVCLIEAKIDNLAEINTAFGRPFGDDAIAGFAVTLRRLVPPFSITCYHGAGRYSVLTEAADLESARATVDEIRMALVDEPIGRSEGLRLTASFWLAHSDQAGFSLGQLRDQAHRARVRLGR